MNEALEGLTDPGCNNCANKYIDTRDGDRYKCLAGQRLRKSGTCSPQNYKLREGYRA